MVRVIVRDEDLPQLDEAYGRLQQLSLSPLRAVEEQALASPSDEERRRCAARCRHRSRRADEDEIEVHRPIVEACEYEAKAR